MNSITQSIGTRIRNYRLLRSMTQEELAEKAEVHHTYIGQVERGEKNLTIVTLEKILFALNVSFTEFFEHLDFSQSKENTASQCYDIIASKTPAQQEKIYRILCDLDELIKQYNTAKISRFFHFQGDFLYRKLPKQL